MEAGRELDAMIAEKVMGLPNVRFFDVFNDYAFSFHPEAHTSVPHYSTDIAAAWLVVEKAQSLDWALVLVNMMSILGKWQSHFERDRRVYTAESFSAPLAICLAALKTVEAK